jgi:hypothetical protein
MPRGNLTAGALKHLLEQRDNKLFDSISALCLDPHVVPVFPPGALLPLPSQTHLLVHCMLCVYVYRGAQDLIRAA